MNFGIDLWWGLYEGVLLVVKSGRGSVFDKKGGWRRKEVRCVGDRQSSELSVYLVGQMGRAMAVFDVDEVVLCVMSGTGPYNEGEGVGFDRAGGWRRKEGPCVGETQRHQS